MHRGMIALGLAGWLYLASSAMADISYSYVTDASNYNVQAGGTVTAIVYLQEALTGGSTSLINLDGGLYNAAVNLGTASGSSTYSSVTGSAINTTDFSNNLGNSAPPPSGSLGHLLDQAYTPTSPTGAFASGPSMTVVNGSTTNLLYQLGTFTFTAGSTAGVDTYQLNPYSTNGGFTTTYGAGPSGGIGYDLDFTNGVGGTGALNQVYTGTFDNSPTSFTVTVQAATGVPEPGSLVLCGLFASGMVGGYIRRRRLAKANAA